MVKKYEIVDGNKKLVYNNGKPVYLYDDIEGRTVMGAGNGRVYIDGCRTSRIPKDFGLRWVDVLACEHVSSRFT